MWGGTWSGSAVGCVRYSARILTNVTQMVGQWPTKGHQNLKRDGYDNEPLAAWIWVWDVTINQFRDDVGMIM